MWWIPIVIILFIALAGVLIFKLAWNGANKKMEPFTAAVYNAGYKVNVKKKTIDVNGFEVKYNALSQNLAQKLQYGYVAVWRAFQKKGVSKLAYFGRPQDGREQVKTAATAFIVIVYAPNGGSSAVAAIEKIGNVLKTVEFPGYPAPLSCIN